MLRFRVFGCFVLRSSFSSASFSTLPLSMGVNFPNVHYIVNFGPARSLLDFHQQAGRAGRDGKPSDVILYFYGQQLAHCDEDVHTFLKSTGCYRVASYVSFDLCIVPLSPLHDCCNNCAISCTCYPSNGCKGTKKSLRPVLQLSQVPCQTTTVELYQKNIRTPQWRYKGMFSWYCKWCIWSHPCILTRTYY